jgi:hypothetical protein
MAHEFILIEIILWIIAIGELFVGFIILFRESRKENSKYILGISIFVILFFISRICNFINVYYVGYSYDTYLLDDPLNFWLQFGYNIFSYIGLFILYFVIETYIVKTRYIFTACVVILSIIAITNYFVVIDIFVWQIPFFAIVLLGIPSIYIYLAFKSSGNIRKNSLYISLGMLLFEMGVVFGVPNIQRILITSVAFGWIFEILAPILHIIGIFILIRAFTKKMAE